MKITVMSWNIAMGKDMDGIVKHIAEVKPDILGLQEVTFNHPNAITSSRLKLDSGTVIADKLKRDFNLRYNISSQLAAFEKSDRHETKHGLGNMIFVKNELLSNQLTGPSIPPSELDLFTEEEYREYRQRYPARDAEPRSAVHFAFFNHPKNELSYDSWDGSDVEFTPGVYPPEMQDKLINVFCVHLGVSEEFIPTEITEKQMQSLMKLIGDGKRTILMGDFNIDFRTEEGRRYKEGVEKVMKNVDLEQKPTWSQWTESVTHHWRAYHGGGREREGVSESEPKLLTHRLDQIFVGEGVEVLSFRLGESNASDHKSLIVELEV